ncbi:hypothetical protein BDV26DRAFT_13936 [Aspergillus bertholletiae]|uniref:Uncharacterized protein n=1 Tax=Aspergillus bertholletiae TaxID=1226010 RepID=A0A5N7B1F2_9EURO|nr:hypothetical protein BDV26DRAFT_13936 [Aspergillus bertholletiae]
MTNPHRGFFFSPLSFVSIFRCSLCKSKAYPGFCSIIVMGDYYTTTRGFLRRLSPDQSFLLFLSSYAMLFCYHGPNNIL